MKIAGVFRSDLVVKSLETAREFYEGVKNCILIPYTRDYVLRIEPGNHFSVISKK